MKYSLLALLLLIFSQFAHAEAFDLNRLKGVWAPERCTLNGNESAPQDLHLLKEASPNGQVQMELTYERAYDMVHLHGVKYSLDSTIVFIGRPETYGHKVDSEGNTIIQKYLAELTESGIRSRLWTCRGTICLPSTLQKDVNIYLEDSGKLVVSVIYPVEKKTWGCRYLRLK
ncbi:MAG: hypothetical protein IT289_07635 [Oligoflexia bacterium]|nr:hypothetical protein [Oligoflexia bacterium]